MSPAAWVTQIPDYPGVGTSSYPELETPRNPFQASSWSVLWRLIFWCYWSLNSGLRGRHPTVETL
jgi:hypothetical protein